ncbi:MAG: hypothetical protein V1717_01075 [Candidatus Micrarchaeota archaeon]
MKFLPSGFRSVEATVLFVLFFLFVIMQEFILAAGAALLFILFLPRGIKAKDSGFKT